MTLQDEGLNILRSRKVRFADRFIPHFFAAYACHCFNLMNRRRRIYHEFKRIPDMRLHILMVAPPGFSKSFFMRQCFDPEYGILYTPTIRTTFELSCTEAAWVGSFQKVGSQSVKVMGLAEEFADGIVAIEEFTAITKTLEQKHSLTFEPHLNATLFGGEVSKRIVSGAGSPIKYHTDVTLIAGTQVTKFDISGGLGRRFGYIYWIPSPSDFRELKEAVKNGAEAKPSDVFRDRALLREYRQKIIDFQRQLDTIQEISFSSELYSFLDKRPHFEHLIYRKLALGYTLFNLDKITPKVEVGLDGKLKRMLRDAIDWRDMLLADPAATQVLKILRMRGGRMFKPDLQTELLRYSINWDASSYLIEKLVRMRRIRYNKYGQLEVV